MPKNQPSSSVSRKAKVVERRPAKSGTGKSAGKPAGKSSALAKPIAVKAPAQAASKKAASAAKTAVKAPAKSTPAKPARASVQNAKPAVAKPVSKAKTSPAKPAAKAPANATKSAPARPAAKAAPVKPAPAKAAPAKAAPAKGAPAKAAASQPEIREVQAKPQAAASELTPKIIHMIAEEMAVEEAELTPSASFRDDLNLDEIDVAELLVRAEELFGLKQEFDDEEWENCQTVGDFIALVERRVGESSRRSGASSSSAGRKAAR